MIEITNKTVGPVQLVVRTGPNRGKNFTVLNIPGIGANKNVVYLEDERYTNYIDQAEKAGLIKIKRITKK